MWRALLALWLACVSGCAVQTAALHAAPPAGLPRSVELANTPFFAQTEYQCGPAALATALGAVGVSASPVTLGQQVFLPARGGSLQAEMLAGARRQGVVATVIPGRLEAVLRELAAGHVVVVLQNLGLSFAPLWHYAVVIGYDLDTDEVLLRSGTTRRVTMPLRTFEFTWARSGFWAFVALPPGGWPVTAQADAVVEAAIGFERSATPVQALQSYENAAQRWPDQLPLAIGLGNAAHATGDKRRAAQVFRAAAERHGS
ncbi:MAG: PA2778 family cysteine peptidase, partial [Rhizobacter sp.]|nr:PA2778 family cysteine peptidase [Rhizobacter sp.]